MNNEIEKFLQAQQDQTKLLQQIVKTTKQKTESDNETSQHLLTELQKLQTKQSENIENVIKEIYGTHNVLNEKLKYLQYVMYQLRYFENIKLYLLAGLVFFAIAQLIITMLNTTDKQYIKENCISQKVCKNYKP